MSTVSADHRLDTASAPGWTGLSTKEECTALAQAITIRARVKLAQAYASLYEGWVAEDQARREAAKAAAASAGAVGGPGEPDTAELSASSPPAAQGSPRTRRKFWSRLSRGKRSMF
jgi:hypothetical protein